MLNKNKKNNHPTSSGTQTVALLLSLIVAGVLFFMSFIFFVKFRAYKTVSETLRTQITENYANYLKLNYRIVNNTIIFNDYNYLRSIQTLNHIFSNITCNQKQTCSINGIDYAFTIQKTKETEKIIGYKSALSYSTAKIANDSLLKAKPYYHNF